MKSDASAIQINEDVSMATFRTITGKTATVYGTGTDTLCSFLSTAPIKLNSGECIAILYGISATDEILNKSANDLKLYQYSYST